MLSSTKSGAISISFAGEELAARKKKVEKFLQFQLGKDKGLLWAEIVREIITVPESEILPVPQMPECVIGIYSWRSEMLWIVDLENLLGYHSPLLNSSANLSLMTMIVELDGQFLGLVVQDVNDIVEYDLQAMQPPSLELFSGFLLPFILGHFTEVSTNQMLLLLQVETIFDYSLWGVNIAILNES
ncbi:MAG: chemotaxis protein CheW [Gomphosphaeria aponina SAG 52.96 = DSM 107014]|uniref:Chemotaxis protein CheW n=1 Tax=Gomphosphaeria aponina SAG 52.96 = DSM 107014 TaxID=1521640 RepID=A0A941GTZ7_9CHRO|nr:chemotaxis protein CheW [Gomphosphaeria aponina SAG 52.96 = DSM 107014]